MNPDPESQNDDAIFDGNIDDFDFDFDEDLEAEVDSEYVVMDALSFDREAGTAACDFEFDDDGEDKEPGEPEEDAEAE